MQPSFADEQPVNPFDFWDGADFKLKIRNVEGYRNYDKSEFSSPSALYDGDESRLETIYNGLHDLGEFTDPKNYKSYDELKAKMMRVLGEQVEMGAPKVVQMNQINEPAPTPSMNVMESTPVTSAQPVTAAEMNSVDDDDTMSYFAKLANED